MGLNVDWGVVLAFAGGLVLLYILGKIFVKPARFILKFILNGVAGGVLLWLINLIGNQYGFGIVINPITALIAGFLGIPGVILLLLLGPILNI
jgi:inhibitor of the pro-sigma K processing machinery